MLRNKKGSAIIPHNFFKPEFIQEEKLRAATGGFYAAEKPPVGLNTQHIHISFPLAHIEMGGEEDTERSADSWKRSARAPENLADLGGMNHEITEYTKRLDGLTHHQLATDFYVLHQTMASFVMSAKPEPTISLEDVLLSLAFLSLICAKKFRSPPFLDVGNNDHYTMQAASATINLINALYGKAGGVYDPFLLREEIKDLCKHPEAEYYAQYITNKIKQLREMTPEQLRRSIAEVRESVSRAITDPAMRLSGAIRPGTTGIGVHLMPEPDDQTPLDYQTFGDDFFKPKKLPEIKKFFGAPIRRKDVKFDLVIEPISLQENGGGDAKAAYTAARDKLKKMGLNELLVYASVYYGKLTKNIAAAQTNDIGGQYLGALVLADEIERRLDSRKNPFMDIDLDHIIGFDPSKQREIVGFYKPHLKLPDRLLTDIGEGKPILEIWRKQLGIKLTMRERLAKLIPSWSFSGTKTLLWVSITTMGAVLGGLFGQIYTRIRAEMAQQEFYESIPKTPVEVQSDKPIVFKFNGQTRLFEIDGVSPVTVQSDNARFMPSAMTPAELVAKTQQIQTAAKAASLVSLQNNSDVVPWCRVGGGAIVLALLISSKRRR
ncbi:MAG: hypothetical protein EYC62_04560 [Alphaproteobacteria bacterium]|nr:MAG: hypothetical protein EYC62_04560 [Alphaproteobacteria bacterium]